jgi:hypothetical protein
MPASQMYGRISSCHPSGSLGDWGERADPVLSARLESKRIAGGVFPGIVGVAKSNVSLLRLGPVSVPFGVLSFGSWPKAVAVISSEVANARMEVRKQFVAKLEFLNSFLLFSTPDLVGPCLLLGLLEHSEL